MRVAIVHDYIKEYGGAERVLEALHEIFPDAPVFTAVYLPKFLGPHKKRFENWDIRTSWFQYIPFKEKLISVFRMISPYIFARFDLSEYDIVIVSQTGAYFPNCIKLKSQNSNLKTTTQNSKVKESLSNHKPVHICYCHTPPRYLYGYKTARQWKNNPVIRVLGEIANHFLRVVDFNASRNVDYFIANSNEVKDRIKKFYRREAAVIYPPAVENSKFEARNPKPRTNSFGIIRGRQIQNSKYKIPNTKYYLTGGRLARAKGTDIIIEAFSKLDKTLLVFGRGFAGFEAVLRSKIKDQRSKIQYIGEVTDEEKFELMRNAKAFVFASFDEDFGITPVEAMSVGTPVIAYKSGGVKETVIDGKTPLRQGFVGQAGATGLLYEPNTPEALIKAVKEFEKISIKPEDCIKQAEKFSKKRFKDEILKFIKSV